MIALASRCATSAASAALSRANLPRGRVLPGEAKCQPASQKAVPMVWVPGSSPISTPPTECVACDIVHQVFVTQVDDCPGGDDLEDSGQAGFDLRQVEGDAVMWWFFEGWFGSDWSELGTGELTQDWDGSRLDFVFPFADPNNGDDFGGNAAWGNGCFPCLWDGDYVFDFDFAFDLPADWYAQQQAAE